MSRYQGRMRQVQHEMTIETSGQGLYEMTEDVARWVAAQAIETGLLTLFCRHSSASVTIQENADPDVLADLQTFFKNLVPEDSSLYRHTAEGTDDMPAHIRSALTATSLGIPISAGRLTLGRWQGIYLFEHRVRPHQRHVVLHLIGS